MHVASKSGKELKLVKCCPKDLISWIERNKDYITYPDVNCRDVSNYVQALIDYCNGCYSFLVHELKGFVERAIPTV
jgi:hypothetical protein